MLLALRRQAVAEGNVDLSPFKPLLTYERLGRSKLFAYSGLPQGCRTVFFPGCTLPGSRPGATWRLFEHLQQGIPNLGIVLDCCSKPSHDLGRHERFEAAFGRILRSLRQRGVHRVVTACPNCFRMFKDSGDNLDVAMVYDVVRLSELSGKAEGSGTAMTVHDPCPLRSERQVQDSVRSILEGLGLSLEEMKHRRRLTVCCGEGGAAGFVRPEHARAWSSIRSSESGGRTVVTYCAGCAAFLGKRLPTLHLIDLLFDPDRALTGSLQASQGLRTYLNRLRLKRRFKKSLA
jgi:Fe-S oxidoreductase